MRSNRKWEVAALEKVAVKAAHFVAYEWGAQHYEDMRRFLESDSYTMKDVDGTEIELGMGFPAVVAMNTEHYEVTGHLELIEGAPVYRLLDRSAVRARSGLQGSPTV